MSKDYNYLGKGFTPLRLTKIAVAAALYVVLTVAIAPLAYGPVQFRFAEMLVLLCMFNKDYCWSMALGCLIANFFSPMWALDVPFGTLATILAVICVAKCNNLWIATIFPTVFNGIIIAIELYIAFHEPIWLSMLTVAGGELAVLLAGALVFTLLQKNKTFMKLIS